MTTAQWGDFSGPGGGGGRLPPSSDPLATVQIALTDQVSTFELASLLAVLENIYFGTLWLNLAQNSPYAGHFPDTYAPSPEQTLWIEQLEIGTPNKVRLRGRAREVAAVVAFLGSVLGLPVAATEAYKNVAEGQKAFAEADWLRVQFQEKAAELHAKNRISANAVAHKVQLVAEISNKVPAAAAILANNAIVFAVDSEGPARPARLDSRQLQILQTEALLHAAPALSEYLAARARLIQSPGEAAQEGLARAYDGLKSAIGPINDRAMHDLIARLDGEHP